jgi:hypothetical protein
MRFIFGLIMGFFICTIGVAEIINVVSKGVRIFEHVWMNPNPYGIHHTQPKHSEQLVEPIETNNDKTI